MGYHPRHPHNFLTEDDHAVEAAEEFIARQLATLTMAQQRMQSAQETQARHYNKGRKELTPYNVGDKVMVSTKYIKPPFLQMPGAKKLDKRWFGPLEVLQKITPTTYKIDLPEGSKAHPNINAEYLKPYYKTPSKFPGRQRPQAVEPVMTNSGIEWVVESIIGDRRTGRGQK